MSVESNGKCERHYTIANEEKGYDLAADLTIEDIQSLQKMLSKIISFDATSRSILAEAESKFNETE